MDSKVRPKKLWATGMVAFWLGIGLAVPLLTSFQGEEIRFDNIGVVAAPRDSFQISSAINIDPLSQTHVTAGRLALGGQKGEMLTAKASAELIESGNAMLILDRGEVVLGQSIPPGTMDDYPAGEVDAGDDGGDAPLVAALKAGSFKALAVRGGTIIVNLPGGHVERLTGAQVQLVPHGDGAVTVKGEGLWRGQRSKVTLRSEAPGSDNKVPITVSLKASLVDLTFDGHLVQGVKAPGAAGELDGTAKLAISDVERLVNALGRSWPIGPMVKEMAIEGPFRWQAEMLAFDKASVTIDGNVARGTLGLRAGARGQGVVTGTLAFDTLDVAGYLPRGSVSRDLGAWEWWRQLAASLSGQSTPPVDADIRLSAAKLVSGDHEFGAAAATVAMKGGRLAADVAEIDLLEARATGQVSVDFNRFMPAIRVRGQLDGIRSGKWFKTLTGEALVDGVARVKADLISHGLDPARMAAELRGRFDVQMDKGATIGVALDELRTRVTSDEPEPMSKILARARAGTTKVRELTAVAVISNGVAQLRSSVADHAKGKVQFAGRFDLEGKEYDVRVLTTDGPGPAVKAGGDRAGVRRVAVSQTPKSRARAEEVAVLKARLLTVRRQRYESEHRISLQPLEGSIAGLQRRLEAGDGSIGRDGF